MVQPCFSEIKACVIPTDFRAEALYSVAWINKNACYLDSVISMGESIEKAANAADSIVHIAKNLQTLDYYEGVKLNVACASANAIYMDDVYNKYVSCVNTVEDKLFKSINSCLSSEINSYNIFASDHHLSEISCLSDNIQNIIYLADKVNTISDAASVMIEYNYEIMCIGAMESEIKCIYEMSSTLCNIKQLAPTLCCLHSIEKNIVCVSNYNCNLACVATNMSAIINAGSLISQIDNFNNTYLGSICIIESIMTADPGLNSVKCVSSYTAEIDTIVDNIDIIRDFNTTADNNSTCLINLTNCLDAANACVNIINQNAKAFSNKLTCITDSIYPELLSTCTYVHNAKDLALCYSDMSRKWAIHDVGYKVDCHDYSAKHYAACAKKYNCNYVDDNAISTNTAWSSAKTQECFQSTQANHFCFPHNSSMQACVESSNPPIIGSMLMVSIDEDISNKPSVYLMGENKCLIYLGGYKDGLSSINRIKSDDIRIFSSTDVIASADALAIWQGI